MILNLIYDPSMADAPGAFTSGLDRAVREIEADFPVPITVNIRVGYGSIDGRELPPGSLGISAPNLLATDYATFKDALTSHATTPTAIQAAASLPETDPTGGAVLNIGSAEAKALGMLDPSSPDIDGEAAFSSFVKWGGGGPANPGYSARAVAWHELTHAMGRVIFGSSLITTMNLFDYTAPGVVNINADQGGYFSIDGGQTSVAPYGFGTGDASDWESNSGPDAFDEVLVTGKAPVTSYDLTVMDALGFGDPSRGSSAHNMLAQAMASFAPELAPATKFLGLYNQQIAPMELVHGNYKEK